MNVMFAMSISQLNLHFGVTEQRIIQKSREQRPGTILDGKSANIVAKVTYDPML
jgi:hypothetical protein